MTTHVVDTNVAIVANGRGTHADRSCQLACVEKLEHLSKDGTVAVDLLGLILAEYANHMRWSGYPGVGDRFFKYVFDNQYWDGRVRRVSITTTEDDQKGFEELSVNVLDRSDRKFLAVAVAADAVIVNATDSDWSENQPLMDHLGVEVEQLCPHCLRRGRHEDGWPAESR